MKYCSKCGAKIDGEEICPKCGVTMTDTQTTQPTKKSPKIILAIIGCLVVGLGVSLTSKNDANVTSTTNTTIVEEIVEEIDISTTDFIEEVEEVEVVEETIAEEIELVKVFDNDSAHELYQEYIEFTIQLLDWYADYHEAIWTDFDKVDEEKMALADIKYEKIKDNKYMENNNVYSCIGNLTGFEPTVGFSYDFLDIDNNGIDELIIIKQGTIIGIYNIIDEEIEFFAGYSGGKHYYVYITTDFNVYIHSGWGASDYNIYIYELIDNKFTLIDFYESGYTGESYFYQLPVINGEVDASDYETESGYVDIYKVEAGGLMFTEEEESEFKNSIKFYEFNNTIPIS